MSNSVSVLRKRLQEKTRTLREYVLELKKNRSDSEKELDLVSEAKRAALNSVSNEFDNLIRYIERRKEETIAQVKKDLDKQEDFLLSRGQQPDLNALQRRIDQVRAAIFTLYTVPGPGPSCVWSDIAVFSPGSF